MTALVYAKLAVIFCAVGVGWLAASRGWLGGVQETADGRRAPSPEVARILSAVVFTLLIPALLFRTMARIDLAAMPWRTLAAYMVPLLVFAFAIYWLGQRRARHAAGAQRAVPATRAIAASYGNAVQLGIPMAVALFGEQGLALHVSIVSIHGMLLLLMLTALVEMDLAHDGQSTMATLRSTARQLLVHPVVLPVLAGLCWNVAGLPLPTVADELLQNLGQAAIPVCLLLIGISLATYGLRGAMRAAVPLVLLKLIALPALVLAIAHWLFGLSGMPLGVLVMMASMPAGANALIFSQRYGVMQGEVTAAVVVGTIAFVVSASGWLALLAWIDPQGIAAR